MRGPAVAPALVGRDQELATVVAAVRQPPAVVVVEGEAGIGKTRLVTELRRHSDIRGRLFAVGSCRRSHRPLPLGPVIDAVRVLGDELAGSTLSPVTGALRPLLPELSEALPPQPPPLDDRDAQRYRVFRGLVDVIASLGPAVLVLEDMHWSDEHTADFVSYLLGDPPPRLSLVVTYRGENVAAGVRATVANPPGSVRRARVVLEPLDQAQTGALAAAILGLDRVSEGFAECLCERAAGVPFAIEELLALLRDRGELARLGGGRARKALSELDVPTSINDQVLERVGRLGDAAREIVEAAAVLQRPVPESVLADTRGTRDSEAVAAALDSGLLVEHADLIGFRHVLASQAVYDGLPGPRRRQLHARAASAFATETPVPLGQVANHLRHAGQLSAYVQVAEQAAEAARERGYDDETAWLLAGVLRQTRPGFERRGRLAVDLAHAALQMLHFDDDIIGLLAGVLEQEPPGPTRGELRLGLGLLLERAGADHRVQRGMFASAVPELTHRPELAAQAMVALAMPGARGAEPDEHRVWLDRIVDVLPAIDDRAYRVGMCGKVAMVQVWTGDGRWRRMTGRMVELTGGAARRRREVIAYYSVGVQACYAGHLAAADWLVTAGLDGAVASGDEPIAQWLSAARALLDFCHGAWAGLAERADALVDRLADDPINRADVEVVAGCLALARGEVDLADRRLAEVATRLELRGGYDLLSLPYAAMIRLALVRGDVDGALHRARRIVATMSSPPFQVGALRALPAVTEATVAAGQVGQARAVFASWADEAGRLDAPLAPAVLPHARGFLVAANRQWVEAAADFLAAAGHYDRLRLPYEAALAREQAASSLLRARDQPAAVAALRAASAAFSRVGATWDLDRASATTRRLGVPVPARHRQGRKGYGPGLSPREREVAELAAGGRTNNEIAEALFVSPNIVKKQLASAMRKLGVGSRRALAGRVGGDGERRPPAAWSRAI